MGTRSLIVIRNKGVMFGQYVQFDGYPDGVGVGVLNELKRLSHDALRRGFQRARFLTQEQASAAWLAKTAPQLSREYGEAILEYFAKTKAPEVYNEIKFAAESLMCEWAWMVDFDSSLFRAFKGFNKAPLPRDAIFKSFEEGRPDEKYFPIREVTSWSLRKLPSEGSFLGRFS